MSHACTTRVPTIALACAALLTTGACFGLNEDDDEGASCRNAGDCQETCSPIGECVLDATALDIRLSWTINGAAPTPQNPGPCDTLSDFEVRFESDGIRDDAFAFFPVPCENGTVFYPDMPSRLTRMILTGVNPSGEILVQEVREITEIESLFALELSL